MTAALGAVLVAIGVVFILLGSIWYLVVRHRTRHADRPSWTPAFADQGRPLRATSKRPQLERHRDLQPDEWIFDGRRGRCAQGETAR